MPQHFSLLVNGHAVSADETLHVINPANEKVIAQAPVASMDILDRVVDSANEAFGQWRRTDQGERRRVLDEIAGRLRRSKDELARLLTTEQGKPLASAEVEIAAAAYWCETIAGMALPGESMDLGGGVRSAVERRPLGAVAAIVPWNFPIGLAFWKIAPALITGNTVVLKPSPFTPLTTLRIGEILSDAAPPGVLNIVSGDDDLGPALTRHAGIAKISFTGSTPTGRAIMRNAAERLTPMTLELGGNDPAIVLPTKDISGVAKKLFWAAFRNSGQFCIAAKRIYVHASIYDAFARELVAYARSVRLGDGLEPGVELGPVQNLRQYERVTTLLNGAKASGLRFLCGADQPSRPGYFVSPAILDDPPDSADVVTQEAFGPVVPLLRFEDFDDVVTRANDSAFGLAASVWGDDAAALAALAARLDVGTVWINDVHYMSPFLPFGGLKQSGFGTENGRDGLLAYTKPKVTITREIIQ